MGSNVLLPPLRDPNRHERYYGLCKTMGWLVCFPRIISTLFFRNTKRRNILLHGECLEKPKRLADMARSSSSLLQLIKNKVRERLCLWEKTVASLLSKISANQTMCVPRSLALPHIQTILQHSTMISKTAGAVLKPSIRTTMCSSGLRLPEQHYRHSIYQNSAKPT